MNKAIQLLKDFEEKYCTMNSGKQIKVKHLEIEQLENIVNHLKKKLKHIDAMVAIPTFKGEAAISEIAQMNAETEWVNLMNKVREDQKVLALFKSYLSLKKLEELDF